MPAVKTPFHDCVLLHLLSDGVAAINTQISARHVLAGIAGQEGDCAHQVFRHTHLADWDEAGPLLCERRVVVENLPRAACLLACCARRESS